MARFVAQGGDEAVCEVSSDRLLETFERGKAHSDFPPDDLMPALWDLFFTRCNMYMPLLHRPTFEQGIADGLHLRDEGFGSTVLLACAIGARFSGDPRVLLEGTESEQDLFGGRRVGGYAVCEAEGHAFLTAHDGEPGTDGDPAIHVDVASRTITWRDRRAGTTAELHIEGPVRLAAAW